MGILSVLLLLLKIIAFTFLFILAAVLAVVVIVLIMPLSYSVSVIKNDGVSVKIRSGWMLGIIRFMFDYDGLTQHMKLTVFGREAGSGREKRKKQKKPSEPIQEDETPAAEEMPATKAPDSEMAQGRKPKKEKKRNQKPPGASSDKLDDSDSTSLAERIRFIIDYPDKKELTSQAVKLLKRLIRAVKPRYFHLSGEVGFESPKYTGWLFGALGIIQGIAGINIHMTGNFTERIFLCDLKVRGNLTLLRLVLPVVRFVLSKPVWRIVRERFFK